MYVCTCVCVLLDDIKYINTHKDGVAVCGCVCLRVWTAVCRYIYVCVCELVRRFVLCTTHEATTIKNNTSQHNTPQYCRDRRSHFCFTLTYIVNVYECESGECLDSEWVIEWVYVCVREWVYVRMRVWVDVNRVSGLASGLVSAYDESVCVYWLSVCMWL